MSAGEARDGEVDKSSLGAPSTSGRLFEASSSGYSQRGLPKEGSSQGRKQSPGSRDMHRVQTASSGHLKGRQSLPSVRTSSGSNLPTELDKAAPLDLRNEADDGESPLTKLKRRAGHELSQGLTSLLNAPHSSSSSGGGGQQMGSLGVVWCWPFGADPTTLPPVRPADFQPFLRDCAAAQSRFEAGARPRGGESAASRAAVTGEHDSEFGARPAPGEGLVEAMRAVPSMFFEEDFSLARPGTWREVVSTEGEAQRLARLDEYGGYLDVVESQLLKEIAARSEHFFEAAGVVQDLRATLHRTYSQVTALRRGVGLLRADTQRAAEAAMHHKRRKANMKAVLDKLKVVEEVASAQETVGLLLPQGDYTAALDVLDSLRASLASYRTAGLHAFRHLPAQLADIAEAVDSILSSEFLRATQFQDQALVVGRISAGLASAGPSDDSSAEQLVAEVAAAGEQQRGSLAEELTPLVLGLKRTGHLFATVRVLRVAAAEEARQGIRDVVEQVLERLVDDKSSLGTSEKLQALLPGQFIVLLGCVARAALASLAHIQRVRAAVEEVLKGVCGGRSLVAPAAADFAEVAQAVSEAAHGRWIKLLAARSSAVVGLELGALKTFLDASQKFADAMHAAGCKPVLALRNACQVQSKAYLESMHHMSLARLASVLEHETWAIMYPPRSCQAIIDDIFQRAGRPNPSAARSNSSQNGQGDVEAEENVLEKLSVGNHEYSAVESELLLLELVSQYLRFVDVVPPLAAEVAHRVVELVKVFNSRTCQLVLGAGAMQVAGLKSITAKHLALSCQCIGALIELHPALAAALGCHLPVSRVALLGPELGLVLQDLTLHRGEVHGKLVGIMRERLIAALKQLPAIADRWGAVSVEGDITPSSFSLGLAKQLRTLSKVLEPLLLEEEVQAVFGRVEALYSKNLAEAFTRLEPLGPGWERQAAADLKFLLAALKELPAARGPKEASLERLQQLCDKRFRTPEESPESRLSPTPSPAKERGSSPSRRSTIVSRLGTTKLPFFKRDRGTSAASTETSAENTGALQTEGIADAVNSSTEGIEDESAPPVEAAYPSHAGEVASQQKTAELAMRETAESLLDFAAEEDVGQASKPVNRLQSFEEDDNDFARYVASAPDVTEPASAIVSQVTESEPPALRGESLQSSVMENQAQDRALGGSVSDLFQRVKAAEAVISEVAESTLDSKSAALDLGAEAGAVSQSGPELDSADGLVNIEESTGYSPGTGSAINSGADSEGLAAVDADVVPKGEEKSEQTPQRNAVNAIEEMLNNMQIESWESEHRP